MLSPNAPLSAPATQPPIAPARAPLVVKQEFTRDVVSLAKTGITFLNHHTAKWVPILETCLMRGLLTSLLGDPAFTIRFRLVQSSGGESPELGTKTLGRLRDYSCRRG